MAKDLSLATFMPYLNGMFQATSDSIPALPVELVEAAEVHAPVGYQAFSLVFRGPPDHLLPQGIYRFQHAAIGTFELFIVPIRQDQHGLYYEAVFNRLLEEVSA
jgi:hypothetical protein